MKFICLGFLDEANWNEMAEAERESFMERCFAYDDELRKGGHFLSGEALQSIQNAATVRYRGGKVVVTDGPFAETKEVFAGYYIFDLENLDAAIEVAARVPAVRLGGSVEVRPLLTGD